MCIRDRFTTAYIALGKQQGLLSVYIVYNNLQGFWQTTRLTECLHSLQQPTKLLANNIGLQVYSSLMAPGKQQGLLSIYMVYNSLQQSLHG